MSEPIHIISLGAGVQSSAMALMAAKGLITPMPEAAIFADTGSEPKSVYDYLAYLVIQLPFPVHTVTAGNIEDDFLRLLGGESEKSRCGQPPFYVKQPNSDDTGGTLWRQCTKEYKLEPIVKKIRELRNGRPVVQWIGISLDEAHRMKDSRVGYVMNRYPLVDERKSRHDCLLWLERNGYKQPPKSACRICPYLSDKRWRLMRDTEPDEFAAAVEFDNRLRRTRAKQINGVKITGELFLHRSCKPLSEVDLSNESDYGQISLFGNECEGMCGV